jgi:diguanylate cyclase (GGDEF)-like protein
MKKKQKTLKIVIAYVVFSLMWLIFSNNVLGQLSNGVERMLKLDQYRGYFYVILSSSFLYFVMSNMEIRYISKVSNLKARNTVLKQHIEVLGTELDSNEHTNRTLEGYANSDELTGLFRRRKGLELIREQVDQLAELNDSILMAFIDIDNLKMINDTFGHIEGDVLLKSVATMIRDSLARKDIICRYGGDEFLAVLPGACMKDMQGIKNRLEASISNYNAHSLKSYEINISIGFSECNAKNRRNIEELIQEADDRMYDSKRAKKLHLVSNFR